MGRKKKSGGDGGGAPAWMATFADMMSLLLTFFILLLSFAKMDVHKFQLAMGSINQALGFMPSGSGMFQNTNSPTDNEKPMPISATKSDSDSDTDEDKESISKKDMILKELEELIEESKLSEDIEIEKTRKGIVMRVKGKMFFNPGTAILKPESYATLEEISQIITRFESRISIEGHTDNIPLTRGQYANNWELSTARAYSALKFLQDHEGIDAQNINIAGFSDTHPITTNDTPEGRATNRRVEFVFIEE